MPIPKTDLKPEASLQRCQHLRIGNRPCIEAQDPAFNNMICTLVRMPCSGGLTVDATARPLRRL